VVLATLAALV
jgi:hypothetical protein